LRGPRIDPRHEFNARYLGKALGMVVRHTTRAKDQKPNGHRNPSSPS
jgi:hypothetical protein